jgi:D-aminoacyl-tRNA deacylase
MRAVVQRVREARVKVNSSVEGEIKKGLLIFLGIAKDDQQSDADYLADKIINLRIFEDNNGKMNLSALDLERRILVVSQFTLYGDCRKGRRPGFSSAADPVKAEGLYRYFIEKVAATGLRVATGRFRAMMDVELINDGPVTLLLDSQKNF